MIVGGSAYATVANRIDESASFSVVLARGISFCRFARSWTFPMGQGIVAFGPSEAPYTQLRDGPLHRLGSARGSRRGRP